MSSLKKSQTLSEETIEASLYSVMCGMSVNQQLIVMTDFKQLVYGYMSRFKREMDRQYSAYQMHTSRSKPRFLLVTRTK